MVRSVTLQLLNDIEDNFMEVYDVAKIHGEYCIHRGQSILRGCG